jgi:hypothetical protein
MLDGCEVVLRDGDVRGPSWVTLFCLAVLQALILVSAMPAAAATAGTRCIVPIQAVTVLAAPVRLESSVNPGARELAITITAVEGSGATIDPVEVHYCLVQPADAMTTITWNDASRVSSIVDGEGRILGRGIDYVVGSLNDRATLAILDVYLSGKLLAEGAELQLTVNFDAYAPAVFIVRAVCEAASTQHTLTVLSTAGGSVIEPGIGAFAYAANTVVGLVAVAHDGYHFSGWSGDVDSISQVAAASTSITMNGSYNITANFAAEIRGRGTSPAAIAGIIAAIVAVGLVVIVVVRRRTGQTTGQ